MERFTRVLHVLKIYRPDFSGEGMLVEHCTGMMDALAPAVKHDLLVTRTPEPAAETLPKGAIDRLAYVSRARVSHLKTQIGLLAWFLRNVWRYDVVHFRTHADRYFLTYCLTKLLGKRLVISATLDDSIPGLLSEYRPSRRPVAKTLFRLFDAFVSVGQRLDAETRTVMPAERCHLIECGIKFPESDRARGLRLRESLGIPADALVFIFVGGLCDRKDPMLLVRNHAAIESEVGPCWLLLLGPELEPDYVARLHAVAAEQGIAGRVLFLGQIENPHLYFEAADLMTFASKREGFGMAVPEAMGHGLAAVVRHLPGVNDSFVIDGETGYFFDDDAGYRAAVLRLARDPALRQRIGEAGRALVRRKYDLGQCARAYLAAYGLGPAPDPAEPPVSQALSDASGPIRTASIADQRLHAPIPVDPRGRPRLIVLVDAEEAFDWTRPFSRASVDVSSMAHQEAAQRIYERYAIRPTYLADYPVVSQDAGRVPLLELLRDGRCDVGAQLHCWVTPPFEERVSAWHSYMGNLPLALQREKIARLTGEIAERFQAPPQIFRSGRFGAGTRTAELLLEFGYLADSSIMPHWDFSPSGGPDYSALGARPHWLDTERRLLEIPSTVGLLGALAHQPAPVIRGLTGPLSQQFHLPGILVRLGLLERIRLTPEGTTPGEARRLIRAMLAEGHRTFVVSYHSPSLEPGNTPYVRTAEDLRRFLGWLDEVLDFFRTEAKGEFCTWRDLHDDAVGAGKRDLPAVGAEPAARRTLEQLQS